MAHERRSRTFFCCRLKNDSLAALSPAAPTLPMVRQSRASMGWPTTFLLKTSLIANRCNFLSFVACSVLSACHSLFGPSAVKSRRTRSSCTGGPGFLVVPRLFPNALDQMLSRQIRLAVLSAMAASRCGPHRPGGAVPGLRVVTAGIGQRVRAMALLEHGIGHRWPPSCCRRTGPLRWRRNGGAARPSTFKAPSPGRRRWERKTRRRGLGLGHRDGRARPLPSAAC